MRRSPGTLAVVLLLSGCASAPVTEEVRKIREWERSLTVELAWPFPGKKALEDAVLEVHADDLPRLGDGAHFLGQTYVEVDGLQILLADIEDSHSNIQNAGVMRWYQSMRSGVFRIHYRYTFYRSHSSGPNYQDRFRDWAVIYSGVKSLTLEKRAPP
jgi:hypothetical protein